MWKNRYNILWKFFGRALRISLGMRFGSRVFPFDRFLRHVSYRILMKDEANGMGLFISFFLGGGGEVLFLL